MKRRQVAFLAVLCLLLPACGGKKRPPAVAQGAGGREASRPPETLEATPEMRPLGPEGVGGENFDSDEGGPLADIHFEYDHASLTDEAKGILEKHALWLQANRNAKVRVEGHCDERGTVEYNLALGDKRAQAAQDYLVSLGVARDRVSSVSFGKEKPLDSGRGESAWARNRRAHFRVSR